jgi:hypothetical protein
MLPYGTDAVRALFDPPMVGHHVIRIGVGRDESNCVTLKEERREAERLEVERPAKHEIPAVYDVSARG